MIPFEDVWLPEIVGYCQLVTENTLWDVWVNHSQGKTSVTDFDELYEQIFDDLDSDAFDENLQNYLPENELLRSSIATFLQAIRDADLAKENNKSYTVVKNLLNSSEWNAVVAAANNVLSSVGSDSRKND